MNHIMLLFSPVVTVFIYTEWDSWHACSWAWTGIDFCWLSYSACRLSLYPLNWCALWWPVLWSISDIKFNTWQSTWHVAPALRGSQPINGVAGDSYVHMKAAHTHCCGQQATIAMYWIPCGNFREFLKFWRELEGTYRSFVFFSIFVVDYDIFCLI